MVAQNGESLGSYMKQPKLSEIKLDKKGTKNLRSKVKKSSKIKITINLDEDIILRIKKQAAKTGVPYQNLINKMLQEYISRENNSSDRITKIEKEIKAIKKKISA